LGKNKKTVAQSTGSGSKKPFVRKEALLALPLIVWIAPPWIGFYRKIVMFVVTLLCSFCHGCHGNTDGSLFIIAGFTYCKVAITTIVSRPLAAIKPFNVFDLLSRWIALVVNSRANPVNLSVLLLSHLRNIVMIEVNLTYIALKRFVRYHDLPSFHLPPP
jgi:hypothetical protein